MSRFEDMFAHAVAAGIIGIIGYAICYFYYYVKSLNKKKRNCVVLILLGLIQILFLFAIKFAKLSQADREFFWFVVILLFIGTIFYLIRLAMKNKKESSLIIKKSFLFCKSHFNQVCLAIMTICLLLIALKMVGCIRR